MSDNSLKIRVFAGPSLLAPFPALVAEIGSRHAASLPAEIADTHLLDLLPGHAARAVAELPAEAGFERLAYIVTCALHDPDNRCGLESRLDILPGGGARFLLAYLDARAAEMAVRAGLTIAEALLQALPAGAQQAESLGRLVSEMEQRLESLHPDYITRQLMLASRARNIPIHAVAQASRVWMYGQGSAGFHGFEAGSHQDSMTGLRISQDKVSSNQLLTQLGFPGVRHGVATDRDGALRVAKSIGYPVVVKPIRLGKGLGVTTQISSDERLVEAFELAFKLSRRPVIVERQLAGDDHRLAVVGGRFAWAVRRTPAQVVGNGSLSILALIDAENDRRREAIAAGKLPRLTLDDDMRATIARQNLVPEDIPGNGETVHLRGTANTDTGGAITDCTDVVHEDNRDLAEAIARSLRMDTVGIDFMTTDVARSWREGECGVIEVNETPGFSSEGRAELILREKIPEGSDGRIPSVVIIGDGAELLEPIVGALALDGRRVGSSDERLTLLDGQPRCGDSARLSERVLALILDPACEALAVVASVQEIEERGFPLDKCDLALVADATALPDALSELLEGAASRVIAGVTSSGFDSVRQSIEALLLERARIGPAKAMR